MSRSIIRGASGESPGVLWGLNPWQRAKQIIRNSPRGDARQDICPLARTSKPINAFALALCDNCIDCFGEKESSKEGKMDFESEKWTKTLEKKRLRNEMKEVREMK